jgi:hypothetical protein
MKRVLLLLGFSVHRCLLAATPDVHCYKLHMSPWSPSIRLGGDEVYTTVPEAFELTNTPSRTIIGKREEFLVTPVLGAKPSVHEKAYWYLENGRIELVWTNGFSGVSMNLKRGETSLKGSAHTFWDFDRPTQTSTVNAQEVPCSESVG